MCGSRAATGSPSTSTSGTSSRHPRPGSGRRARASRAASCAASRRHAPAAPPPPRRSPAGSRSPGTRPRSRSSSGSGERAPGALAHHEHARPRPGRPTCARWRSAPTSRRRPAAGRPSAPRRPAAGTPPRAAGRGDLGDRLEGADLVVGRLQAGQRRVGRAARRRTRPGRPAAAGRRRPSSTVPPSRSCRSAACSTLECSTARDQTAADPCAGPRRVPSTPRCDRLRAGGGEGHLVRPGAERLGDRLAGRVEQQPGPAGLAVEPRGVGPAVVERGQQRLARRRVQRLRGGGVEVRHGPIVADSRRTTGGAREGGASCANVSAFSRAQP